MDDPDLIARLYPYGGADSETVIRELNPSRCRLPPPSPPRVDFYASRETTVTPSPEGSEAGDHDHGPFDELAHVPHLELRFSAGPRTGQGFVLGRRNESKKESKDTCTTDIVLVNSAKISTRHCAITFETGFRDKMGAGVYRLVLRDLNSPNGIAVQYDGQGGRQDKGIRRGFRWILGGHDPISEKKNIILQLDKLLMFRIVVSPCNVESQEYQNNVRRFLQGTATADSLLGQLHVGLPSYPPTLPQTEAPTPGKGPICLTRRLGQGAFGVVNYYMDVSEGHEFVVKEPIEQDNRHGRVDKTVWKKEAEMLDRAKHEHIVMFIDAKYEPRVQLIFEFVPGGSLDGPAYWNNISVNEGLQILRQLLSALVYLHGKNPSILHRDIKPANILVQHRRDGEIYVKFGDFGLSRERQTYMSVAGTPPFFPPEFFDEFFDGPQRTDVFGNKYLRYTPAVDIWALGVTVQVCVYSWGKVPSNHEGTLRCRGIVAELDELGVYRRSALTKLLGEMVVLEPAERWSAQQCHARALLLAQHGGADDDDGTSSESTDEGYGDGDDEDVQRTAVLAHPSPNDQDAASPHSRPGTPNNQGALSSHSRPKHADNQGVPSPHARSSQVSPNTRKRPTRTSKSGGTSSSSNRRSKKRLHRGVAEPPGSSSRGGPPSI